MGNVIDYPLRPVIIGNLATMQTITGTFGQSFANTTYNALFDWIGDRWWPRPPDPRYGFLLATEEFTGNDRIGTLDWSANNGQLAANLLNPGLASVSTTTVSNLNRMSTQLNTFQLGTMDLYLETIFAIPTLSNGTDNAVFVFGLNDQSSFDANGLCTDGVFFSLNYATDQTHWCTNTTSNGTNTQKISVIAAGIPAAATFYRLGIYINAGVSATFYVNGTAITAAHTTNLPVGAGRQTGVAWDVHKTLGSSTAMTMQVDSFSGYGFFNQARVA